MSINGTISFYQRWAGKGSLRTRFARLIELTGAERALYITRSPWPFGEGDIVGLGEEEPRARSVADALAMRRGIGALGVSLHAPIFGERVLQALRTEIPEDIRDQFAAGDPTVQMGWHLLDDLAPGHRGPDPSHHRPARLSFTLFGYGAPRDWDEYRRRIWQTPVMRELEAQIVEAIGPVCRAISWSV